MLFDDSALLPGGNVDLNERHPWSKAGGVEFCAVVRHLRTVEIAFSNSGGLAALRIDAINAHTPFQIPTVDDHPLPLRRPARKFRIAQLRLDLANQLPRFSRLNCDRRRIPTVRGSRRYVSQ